MKTSFLILWFLGFNVKISKNFCFEANFFHFIRSYLDGVTVIELKGNSDLYEGDHNPQHYLHLILFNFMIFEFRIYNIHHSESKKISSLIVTCPTCSTKINIRKE